MKRLAPCLCLLLVMFCVPAFAPGQSHFPSPPEAADKSSGNQHTTTVFKQRIDAVQLQREAREMLELSQSVQVDINAVNHGLLPKDAMEKLKRIEKLAKHIRGEIAP